MNTYHTTNGKLIITEVGGRSRLEAREVNTTTLYGTVL